MKSVIVKDASGQELASFSLEERAKAFDFAAEMEIMGIEVSISEPSLPETLIKSLGATASETEQLKKEIDEEIDSHGSDCCSK